MPNDNDGNGHGTHCAGTVGGALFGVAKDVTLVAVKVLSASGIGTKGLTMEGIEFDKVITK